MQLLMTGLFFLAGGGSFAYADYVTLAGTPVTQGQMRVAEEKMEVINQTSPGATDLFILKDTKVEVEISGAIARVRLHQTFKNPYKDHLEAVYVFPIPEDAAVDGYSFKVGEQVVKGVVKEKEKARKEYDKAKNEGRKAGLLEQERPNIFTQSLANIPPNEEVVVSIQYVHPVEINGANYLFTFPMVVAPRYIPGNPINRSNVGRGWANDTDQVEDASRITTQYVPPGMRAGGDVSISVKVNAGLPINKITGVTHELITKKVSESEAQISLKAKSVIPNKDFVFEYKVGGQQITISSLTHKVNNDGYFTLIVQPKHTVERKEVLPREVVLVLDKSGSMGGQPINQMRVFAEHVLTTLNPQDSFRVIAFDNHANVFEQHALDARPNNIARGKQFVRSISAGGGTNMLGAMQEALTNSSGENGQKKHLYLVIVTDALVGNDSKILGLLKQSKFSHIRVYPVAMGPAPNDYLIKRAAELGRGFSMRITNQDNAHEIAKQFGQKINFPILTDIKIDWDGLKVTDVLPNPLPDLYADRPLVLVGRYKTPGKGNVKISGNLRGKAVTTKLPFDLPNEEKNNDSLGPVWARAKIKYLINEDLGNPSFLNRREITKLGIEHQLVTKYTSFVAVEIGKPNKKPNNLITRVVRSIVPEGMDHLFKGQGGSSQQQYIQKKKPDSYMQNNSHNSTNRNHSRPIRTGGGGSVEWMSVILATMFLFKKLFLKNRKLK